MYENSFFFKLFNVKWNFTFKLYFKYNIAKCTLFSKMRKMSCKFRRLIFLYIYLHKINILSWYINSKFSLFLNYPFVILFVLLCNHEILDLKIYFALSKCEALWGGQYVFSQQQWYKCSPVMLIAVTKLENNVYTSPFL